MRIGQKTFEERVFFIKKEGISFYKEFINIKKEGDICK